jgi:4-alpha-glucanotransferase
MSAGVDEWGITDGYHDIDGHWHATSDETRAALRSAMGTPGAEAPLWFVHPGDGESFWNQCQIVLEDGTDLGVRAGFPSDLPLGYHDLIPLDGSPATRVICAPRSCPSMPEAFGVSCQLYNVHSTASQGIGDFGDLARVAGWVSGAGGSAVLLSPLHAPDLGGVIEPSPYFPSTRVWRSPLHLHVDGLDGWTADRVDRAEVWKRKRPLLWAQFVEALDAPEWRVFAETHGEPLMAWARWSAQAEGATEAGAIEFHIWLQWMIDQQLAAVRAASPNVALIGDLAIGVSSAGFDANRYGDALATGCRVGAPPDGFNAEGQDWGLPPFIPWQLRAQRYEPFIATVRGALRGLQGLRIDHVMGMFRQFWLTPGSGPADGAYVRFPARELLSIIALEATQAGAFVIGEDLGTVEDGVREMLAEFGVARTIVAWFTDDLPSEYPTEALATLSTHDLPTVAGVWSQRDGDSALRDKLNMIGALSAPSAETSVLAAHRALGSAPSRVRLAQLDDLALAEQRANMPGTIDEHPNWRLPLPLSIEQLIESDLATTMLDSLRR